ncbi:MAG TPA: N-acetylmuramoyl-L-alanine amidase [Terriglobales bacterium]|nr:N-acetylmuramoyl-L-alanine amidase [Terriglobales bacterium]
MLSSNEGRGRRLSQAVVACALLSAMGLIGAQTSPSPPNSSNQAASAQIPAATPQTGQSPTAPAPPAVQPPPKPLIVIDPAHGGSESGAVLNPVILEKDITLALGRRLRSDLGARGFVAELIRDSDVNLSTDDRASKANSAHPALYVCLHATSEPAGVGIYTSMLADSGQSKGPFDDWDTAQFPFLPASRLAQQEIAAAIQKSGMPVHSLTAPLRPLDNLTSPAVAVELAPTKADVSQLTATDYQESVSAALANGIAQVLSQAGSSPGATQ